MTEHRGRWEFKGRRGDFLLGLSFNKTVNPSISFVGDSHWVWFLWFGFVMLRIKPRHWTSYHCALPLSYIRSRHKGFTLWSSSQSSISTDSRSTVEWDRLSVVSWRQGVISSELLPHSVIISHVQLFRFSIYVHFVLVFHSKPGGNDNPFNAL